MSQQVSPHKVSRMIALYFGGHSETEIANRLKVNQSTVSLYVSRFRSAVAQNGLESAGKEYGVMDEVRALHNLAGELAKAKMTVEEASLGLKMHRRLQALGVPEADYPDLIESVNKLHSEGWLEAAIKLSKLEKGTGMTYGEITARFENTSRELPKAEESLKAARGKLNSIQAEISTASSRRKAATAELEAYMKKVGIDRKRLEKVEALALALKSAGISDDELDGMIQRQQHLDKAGMSLTNFVAILEEAAVTTAPDRGKSLLRMLREYRGLVGAIGALEEKLQTLSRQATGLEEKATQKQKIENDIANLKGQEGKLENTVEGLRQKVQRLGYLHSQVRSLEEQKSGLESIIAGLRKQKEVLDGEIASRQQDVSNLVEVEARHQSLSASVSEMQARLDSGQRQLEVLEAFTGLINASSIDEIEAFAGMLPELIADARQRKISPRALSRLIMRNMGAGVFKTLWCSSCDTRFAVDKPSKLGHLYYCPLCGLMLYVKELEGEAEVLQKAYGYRATGGPTANGPAPAARSNPTTLL